MKMNKIIKKEINEDQYLVNLLDKYIKNIIFKKEFKRIDDNYEFKILKENYPNLYLEFIKIRNKDNKKKNKIKNMNNTSIWYLNNYKNINYKFNIFRIIRNLYFKDISKNNILGISYNNNQKKNGVMILFLKIQIN